jgi:hypothetical protein
MISGAIKVPQQSVAVISYGRKIFSTYLFPPLKTPPPSDLGMKAAFLVGVGEMRTSENFHHLAFSAILSAWRQYSRKCTACGSVSDHWGRQLRDGEEGRRGLEGQADAETSI